MTPIEQALEYLDDIEDAAFGFIGGAPEDVEKLAIESAGRLRKFLTDLQSMQGEAVAWLHIHDNGKGVSFSKPDPTGSVQGIALYTQPQSPAVEITCNWLGDEYGTWLTDCGNAFQFMDGGPEENDYKHCPYCGGALSASQQGDSNE